MITGTGDHLRPEWPITITGMRTEAEAIADLRQQIELEQGDVCNGMG
jgi:hypothetical protein